MKTFDWGHFALKTLGVVGVLFGAAFGVPGLMLAFYGGSWFFLIAGALTMLAGYWIFRLDHRGVLLYVGVCLFALVWSIYDVWPMDSWFWPLIPRLFAFAFALAFVLALAPLLPTWRHDDVALRGGLAGAFAVIVGLLATVFGMFQLHGVTQNAFAPARGVRVTAAATDMGNEWRNYGRTTTGTRFTPVRQITRENVRNLKVAWIYRTGAFADHDSSDQNTPAFANGLVYSCTYNNQVHAIDGVTGERKWLYDAKAAAPFFRRCRGVTYYEVASADGVCARRIAMGTIDARLISLDADTGRLCAGFGKDGVIDLREGMGDVKPGEYMQTSAPTVSNGVIVVGGLILDNYAVGEPSGVVRAFDVKTGEMKWAWDVGRPGKTGMPGPGETFTRYTPNVWTHMAVDAQRGMIFLPLGNATPDMWHAHRRPFDDEFGATLVALDIRTGEMKWKFQTVHKDVWDYDLPSQPSLYDVPDPATGAMVPVIIQPTKRGQLFYLNRETGQPVAEVIEKKVQTTGGAIEGMSPTQPYSVGMPQIGGEGMRERDMWGTTPIDLAACRVTFRKLRYSGDEFTPPGTDRFFTYPGAQGGMNWGSGSIDENRGLFIINDLRLPITTRMVPRKDVPQYKELPGPHAPMGPQIGTPYGLERTAPTSIFGLLCSRPPYGTISAIDLVTKKLVWRRPIGTTESLDFIGVQTGVKIPLGMPTLGGSLVTGGGVVFFGSAMDHYLRALDVETGDELAAYKMPVGANATPMSYVARDGKQYVVISAGGATYAARSYRGDYVIAYTLKD